MSPEIKQEIKQQLDACDAIFANCDLDYQFLTQANINADFFADYNNTRVVNSFLFNFSKLQDKIGGKLFKKILYELKEIDAFSIPMLDVLNLLEKLEIIDNASQWDELREARNTIAHDYPLDINARIEAIQFVIHSYLTLQSIYARLKARAIAI